MDQLTKEALEEVEIGGGGPRAAEEHVRVGARAPVEEHVGGGGGGRRGCRRSLEVVLGRLEVVLGRRTAGTSGRRR